MCAFSKTKLFRQWDLRRVDDDLPVLSLSAPGMDTVTGLSLNPAETHILSNSMDSNLRCWDIRPFFAGAGIDRCERNYDGVHHGAEKVLLKAAWSVDGERVACGSADRYSTVLKNRKLSICMFV